MKAVRIHAHGGPEVLKFEETAVPSPGPGEVRIAVEAVGINFIDTYKRSGLYPVPLPHTLGQEAAGSVVAVGEGVTEWKIGDRVAGASIAGAYAEQALARAAQLVRLPAGVSAVTGAALMLQGLTAHYLATDTFPLKAGDTALVHAAAGGAGQLITQVAKIRGATVYGTVGSEAKAKIAREAGAAETINYKEQDFEAEVKRLTGGRGVDVVYDSVGKDTFDKSLNCLRPRGMLALFGFSSGSVSPFDPAVLGTKGSLFLTRPGLNQYIATRDELLARAADLFAWLGSGSLKLRIDKVLPLAQAADAHRDLEGRRTAGKILLEP